jgi:ribosomal protein S18 acetylase RimI-like enzyme
LVEYHRRLAPAHPPTPALREVIAAEIRRAAARSRCCLLVAARGARLVGFAFAEVEAGGAEANGALSGWVHELWVVPEERRRKVASALLREADAFFAARGVRRVSVRVESGNTSGLRFWEELGFGERARILERQS